MNTDAQGATALPQWFAPENVRTVIAAFPGVYGRLLGKRATFDHFVDQVLSSGLHACDYLLTTDLEMSVVPGFDVASWEKGFGDFQMRPDLSTARLLPWHDRTAIVLCDLLGEDGTPVEVAPRRVLSRQLDRLSSLGAEAFIGSELEFVLFDERYEALGERGFVEPIPSSQYAIDYHILQPARDEHVVVRLREEMTEAGIPIESSKGEAARGQHEVNMVFAEAMEMADRHAIYKTGAKDIASQEGMALSFMAKWSVDDAGNGFHLHTSLWDREARHNLFWDPGTAGPSRLFFQFLGGLLAYSRELTYFFAPTVNSYKRYQPGSWAPTAIVAGHDNRTCGFRVVGRGDSLRIENRMPGADANPYLAFAATLAAGLRGIEEDLEGEVFRGDAYRGTSLPRLPCSLDEATELLHSSSVAREALGSDIVDFYVHTGEAESAAFRRAVTGWERRRYLEQI